MAEAGTTPVGTEPQNAGTNNDGTQQPKLIAGKFKTLEEAVEKGYTGLEQGFHALSENVSKLTKLMETAMASDDGVAVGRGAPNNDPYQRYQPQADDIDPKEFILNPGAVLKKREEQLLGLVSKVVTAAVGNVQIVNDFKAQNRDLVPHERIVQIFLKDENPNLPLADRLASAATKTRGYLAQMKAELSGTARVPGNSEFVEGPSGGGGSGGQAPVVTTSQMSEDEKELIDYINERQANYSSHFGGPPQK